MYHEHMSSKNPRISKVFTSELQETLEELFLRDQVIISIDHKTLMFFITINYPWLCSFEKQS